MRNFGFKEWLDLTEMAKKRTPGPIPSEDGPTPVPDPSIEQPKQRPSIAPARSIFDQRDVNSRIPHNHILEALGIPAVSKQLDLIGRGTFSVVYAHPTDASLCIKITADTGDAKNLQAAQRFGNRNVVKVHNVATLGKKTIVMLVNRVNGEKWKYSTDALLAIMNGDEPMRDYADAATSILEPDGTSIKYMQELGLYNPDELQKLSRVFQFLAQLERSRIFITDFTDNAIDAGEDYVFVDLGL